MNLYELSTFEEQLLLKLENGEEVGDTLDAVNLSIEQKLESYGKVIRLYEMRLASKQSEIKRLQESAKTDENHLKRLKVAVQVYMIRTGKRKVETPLFKYWIQDNAPSVEIVDESLIPKEFYKVLEPVLDKTALKDALKQTEIPGVQMKQTASIRMK